ncbi:MAG: alpha/beta fold hydrolase [Clostridia bacterium]|nr:alpha/beta fold hydrolase [Clostridia bacterium]
MLQEKYLFEDNHDPELVVPAEGVGLEIESEGEKLFGKLIMPAVKSADERTPLLLMLHGHPGNDRNLDIFFALQRTGIATAYFSYRGIWGSYGYYRFSHLIEDAKNVVAYLRAHADEYRIDPDRIYVLGHSMGGFTTINSLAQGLDVKGAIAMAPCDLSYMYEHEPLSFKGLTEVQPGGCFRVPDGSWLREDALANYEKWRFVTAAESIPSHIPLHFIGAENDTVTPYRGHILPIYEHLKAKGHPISLTMINDGHSFVSNRVSLIRTIFGKIALMEEA